MEYTLTLKSQEDYRLIKIPLKAFKGASITPVKKESQVLRYHLKELAMVRTVTMTTLKTI